MLSFCIYSFNGRFSLDSPDRGIFHVGWGEGGGGVGGGREGVGWGGGGIGPANFPGAVLLVRGDILEISFQSSVTTNPIPNKIFLIKEPLSPFL
jgi:hypothetical protein